MFPGQLQSSPALAHHYSALRIPHSAFRSLPAIRRRRAPPPQAGERLRLEVCPVHSAFRTPHSALGFKVDQRVPPLGETRPWLHLDDVVQHRPFDPQRDLPGGALERTPPPGASRGARITRQPPRRGSPSARSTSLSNACASRSRSPTGVKNVRAATIGSGATRPTTGSDTSPAASRHSRRPARPNCDTTASSGSATSAPSVLTPSCSSRRCVSGSSGSTASGCEARNFASPPTGTITASPGFARVAATQETNFPLPHPTRNAERGSGNAEQASELSSSVPRSAFRIPRFIISTISSGPPYSPSRPSVPTYALPSSTGSTTGLTVTSAATSRENCSS